MVSWKSNLPLWMYFSLSLVSLWYDHSYLKGDKTELVIELVGSYFQKEKTSTMQTQERGWDVFYILSSFLQMSV